MLCWFTESRPTAAAAPGSLILRGCAPALLCLGAGVCAESSGPRGAVSRPAASASPAKSPGTPALTQPPSPAPGTWELRPGNRCIVGPSGGSAADWSLGPWSGRWVSVRDNPAPRGRPARSGDTGGQNRDGPGGRQQSSRRPAGQDSTWGLIRPGRDRCPLEAWPGACGARKTGGRPPRPPLCPLNLLPQLWALNIANTDSPPTNAPGSTPTAATSLGSPVGTAQQAPGPLAPPVPSGCLRCCGAQPCPREAPHLPAPFPARRAAGIPAPCSRLSSFSDPRAPGQDAVGSSAAHPGALGPVRRPGPAPLPGSGCLVPGATSRRSWSCAASGAWELTPGARPSAVPRPVSHARASLSPQQPEFLQHQAVHLRTLQTAGTPSASTSGSGMASMMDTGKMTSQMS